MKIILFFYKQFSVTFLYNKFLDIVLRIEIILNILNSNYVCNIEKINVLYASIKFVIIFYLNLFPYLFN